MVTALLILTLAGIVGILHTERQVMSALSDLQAAVAAQDTVIGSAVTLLQAIPGLIAAAGTDPAALVELQNDIVAGTPAATTPAATTP